MQRYQWFLRISIIAMMALIFFAKPEKKQAFLGNSFKDRPDNSEVNAVKQTLKDMWKAIEEEDLKAYAQFIHTDFTQFSESDPVLLSGKAAELQGVAEWLMEADGVHTEMLDPVVQIKDEVAWIVYYWKDRGKNNGVSFETSGKSTRIFVKERGKWLCIHGHYTLLESK